MVTSTLTVAAEASGQISAVATHINEHIKQQDNFIKMLAIQKSLSGASVPPLLVPGRMFVKEGALRKVGPWPLPWEYHFNNEQLSCGQSAKRNPTVVSFINRSPRMGPLPVSACSSCFPTSWCMPRAN